MGALRCQYMPPVGGGPLWWLGPPPSPRCEACHWILSRPTPPYESSSLATPASLVGLWVLSIVPHDSTRKRRADLPLRGGKRTKFVRSHKATENFVRRFPVERCRRQKGCISTGVARFACFPLWRPCRGSPSRAKLVLSLHIKGPPYELPDRCQRRGCLV